MASGGEGQGGGGRRGGRRGRAGRSSESGAYPGDIDCWMRAGRPPELAVLVGDTLPGTSCWQFVPRVSHLAGHGVWIRY